ncbi:MAG: (Fe-S)-binding protein, partial [Candidatus Heimdallarchaeota archaeon]|nr:(Fe-S)-binding protein [Candidatus Heimdallarchaeota archaeon]
MTAEDITREVFRNVHGGWKVLFYVFVVIETAIFLYGFIRLYKKYKKGKKDPINRIDKPISRLFKPFKGWDTYHQLQPGDRWTFIAHTAVVVGMILLFLGTVILTIETDFIRPIDKKFGTDLSFFWGTFYLIFSLIMELAGIAVIAGLIYLARRRRSGIDRLDYARKDGREQSETRKKWPGEDKIFLSFLFVTTMLGFILEGVRIVADKFPDFEAVSFIGLGLAHFFNLFLTPESAEVLYVVLWWTHFIITAVIVAFLPYTKAMHIVIDFISIATVDENSAKRLPKQDPAASAAGYNTINDFSWRDLVSLDACTKCGRCHVSCPAGTVGQPLSPRDLILDLRTHAATTLGTPEWTQRNQTNGNGSEQALIMVEDGQSPIILADTIWSCTTCRACVTHCPVGIEHVPLIVQMRRR